MVEPDPVKQYEFSALLFPTPRQFNILTVHEEISVEQRLCIVDTMNK